MSGQAVLAGAPDTSAGLFQASEGSADLGDTSCREKTDPGWGVGNEGARHECLCEPIDAAPVIVCLGVSVLGCERGSASRREEKRISSNKRISTGFFTLPLKKKSKEKIK